MVVEGGSPTAITSLVRSTMQEIKTLFPVMSDFEDYQKIVYSFLAGKFGPQQMQQALSGLLKNSTLVRTHNRLVMLFLQLCDDYEQRALEAIKQDIGDVSASTTIGSPVPITPSFKLSFKAGAECLHPADLHNRFLTLEDKRELFETKIKLKQLQNKEDQQSQHQRHQRPPKITRIPVDLGNLQYYNYPLSLDVLKTLPTAAYLKKRLALHATSKGLSLFDDDLDLAASSGNVELSYSNTISKSGSLEYFLSAWSRGLDKSALAHNAGANINKILEKPAISTDIEASAVKKQRIT